MKHALGFTCAQANVALFLSASIVALLGAAGHAQGQQPGRGGPPPGAPAFPPVTQAPPKPLIPNAQPVRSCESLATVALPNTTIESATVDAANPGICQVVAITTHPPAGDRVRIWLAIPTSNWNGRFLGTGGGGSRPLCQYPLVAKYKGAGSTDDAANFVCSAGF